MLAQVADFAPHLAQYGLAGIMLVWFMLRAEKRLKSTEASVDRMAKAALLQLVSVGQLDTTIKDQAHQLLEEIKGKEAQEK